MARVDLLHGRQLHHLFYNVDAAVGKDAPNRKDDVMLVQYLLQNASTLGFPQVFKWNQLNYPIGGVWDRNWQGLLTAYMTRKPASETKWFPTAAWIRWSVAVSLDPFTTVSSSSSS